MYVKKGGQIVECHLAQQGIVGAMAHESDPRRPWMGGGLCRQHFQRLEDQPLDAARPRICLEILKEILDIDPDRPAFGRYGLVQRDPSNAGAGDGRADLAEKPGNGKAKSD
jgi:hypothetical protein